MNTIGVGDGGLRGLQPSQRWKNVQKSTIIRQKIFIKWGKIFINNGFLLGSTPKFYLLLRPWALKHLNPSCMSDVFKIKSSRYSSRNPCDRVGFESPTFRFVIRPLPPSHCCSQGLLKGLPTGRVMALSNG